MTVAEKQNDQPISMLRDETVCRLEESRIFSSSRTQDTVFFSLKSVTEKRPRNYFVQTENAEFQFATIPETLSSSLQPQDAIQYALWNWPFLHGVLLGMRYHGGSVLDEFALSHNQTQIPNLILGMSGKSVMGRLAIIPHSLLGLRELITFALDSPRSPLPCSLDIEEADPAQHQTIKSNYRVYDSINHVSRRFIQFRMLTMDNRGKPLVTFGAPQNGENLLTSPCMSANPSSGLCGDTNASDGQHGNLNRHGLLDTPGNCLDLVHQSVRIPVLQEQQDAHREYIGINLGNNQKSPSKTLRSSCVSVDDKGIMQLDVLPINAQFHPGENYPMILPGGSFTRWILRNLHLFRRHTTFIFTPVNSRHKSNPTFEWRRIILDNFRGDVVRFHRKPQIREQVLKLLPLPEFNHPKVLASPGIDLVDPTPFKANEFRCVLVIKLLVTADICPKLKSMQSTLLEIAETLWASLQELASQGRNLMKVHPDTVSTFSVQPTSSRNRPTFNDNEVSVISQGCWDFPPQYVGANSS
ncbi:uncharacterized protein LOC129791333 [Lutzomyia longipalpis]|uniref:uncharacterized protein LOC129791333 n=1 Tax=Lutzomyia longipalpis TaxID=7200 RepID=UPI0024841130|nr:uncharacterized protein LOC129791333 [Lutzomyia longipalpis]